MPRAGVSDEHAERCLGHLQPAIQEVYNQTQIHREMAVAYEKLADADRTDC